jgi:curved DNA-binding protein CbpA
MKKVLVRDLIVIDDQELRREYSSEAFKILKQIDRLEKKVQQFHGLDQNQFDQWHRLTFQHDQEAIERSQREYQELLRFHNWVVATAKIMDIEMPEAYARMKEEEKRWQHGSPEVRKKIDQDRRARDTYIETKIYGQYNEEPSYQEESDVDSDRDQHLNQVLSHLEDLLLPEDREAEKDAQVRIDRIMDLSDDELEYFLRDREVAFLVFDLSLSWGETENDTSFFMRMWRLMPAKHKKSFKVFYSSLTGLSLDELVERWGGDAVKDDDTFQNDFINGESFRHDRPTDKHTETPDPGLEKIKLLYRKLVRRLHPDSRAADVANALNEVQAVDQKSQKEWMNRAWDLVQKAYAQKNLDSLERLFKLTLLRVNALDQLTIDEIIEARGWLKKDLKNLESEARRFKKSPAWGFSVKKNAINKLTMLKRKIKTEFSQTLDSVRSQIEEIRADHRLLERLYVMQGRARPSTSRRRTRRNNNSDESFY